MWAHAILLLHNSSALRGQRPRGHTLEQVAGLSALLTLLILQVEVGKYFDVPGLDVDDTGYLALPLVHVNVAHCGDNNCGNIHFCVSLLGSLIAINLRGLWAKTRRKKQTVDLTSVYLAF